ncbi:MAG: protein kinase [Akkermansiaceae bacterium]|nr:protein kinase [Akkermansiaceae bacterium]
METTPHDPAFEAPSVEELQPLFPSYDIELFIAQGGMGAVYKARQTSLDRPVALKILPKEFGADPQFRASFQDEAKAMARLNHPNLIAVYDFGDVEGMLFIIMEYVEGATLHHSAHGKKIEQTEAARLAAGICRGLAHAHQHGILHRDIKPANVLLTASAQPKIGDFGLARPVGAHHGDELIFGTPGYSAPEVLNHPERVDQRADIYSMGVIFYELLTGRLPGETWQPPSSVIGSDPAFDPILRRAMHPSPEMRYADADQIADDLESAASKIRGPLRRQAGATPATPGRVPVAGARPVRTTLPSAKSSGSPAAIAIVVLLVLGGVAALVAVALNGGNEAPPTARPSVPESTPAPKPEGAAPRPPREKPAPNPANSGRQRPSEGSGRDLAGNDRPRDREKPMPKPDPEPAPAPEPIPEPAAPEPIFDTFSFLDKGRTALARDAGELFQEHEKELLKNVERFERGLKRVVRRVDRQHRDRGEALIEQVMAPIRGNNRLTKLPIDKLPGFLEGYSGELREVFAEALEDQEKIDRELESQLEPLRDAYVNGISRQVDALREKDDPAAVAILETEARKTADSLPRFIRILKGEDPDPPAEPEDAPDGEEQNKKD